MRFPNVIRGISCKYLTCNAMLRIHLVLYFSHGSTRIHRKARAGAHSQTFRSSPLESGPCALAKQELILSHTHRKKAKNGDQNNTNFQFLSIQSSRPINRLSDGRNIRDKRVHSNRDWADCPQTGARGHHRTIGGPEGGRSRCNRSRRPPCACFWRYGPTIR